MNEETVDMTAEKTPRVRRGANGGTSPLPEGHGWRPHIGRRQRLRELKRNWKRLEPTLTVGLRDELLDAVVGNVAEADEELACWFAGMAATVRARDTGKPVHSCLQDAIRELRAAPRVAKGWTDAPAS